MSEAIHILLCTDSAARRQRWSQALENAACQLWWQPDHPALGVEVDVVVADRPFSAEDEPCANNAGGGELGVIAVGIETEADVSLPAEASDGELRLACLLLGQIVRLRRDRQENLRAREALSQQALSDPLTGLPNRRAYDQEVNRRMRGLGKETSNLCLSLIDLDQFKRVNDGMGHAAGDRILTLSAQALTNSIRSHDFVARLGGDEFAVLISNLAAADTFRVVDRIRASAACKSTDQVTASAGFVVLTEPVSSLDLFRAADRALLQAKRAGRNRTAESRIEGDEGC